MLQQCAYIQRHTGLYAYIQDSLVRGPEAAEKPLSI